MLENLIAEGIAAFLLALIHHLIRKYQDNAAPPEWTDLTPQQRQAFWEWVHNQGTGNGEQGTAVRPCC